MQINLPKHEQYSRVRLTVNTPQGSESMMFGEPHVVANIKLPEGVEERDVEVLGQFLDNGGRPGGDEMLLRSPTPPEPEPEPEPEPKSWDELGPEKQAEVLVADQLNTPEVKDEEAPEEAREEDVHELVAGTPEPVQDVVEDAPEPASEPVQEEVKKHRRKRRSN